MSVRISSVKGAIQGLRRFGFVTNKALNSGVKDAADIAFQQSQIYVPVEFGPLKASGKVVIKKTTQDINMFDIEYGGEDAPYALPVHEIAGAYHAPPTCYKYLEKAIRETKDKQNWSIRRRMRMAMKGILEGEGVRIK